MAKEETNTIFKSLITYWSSKSVGSDENIEQVIKDMHKDLLLLAEEYSVDIQRRNNEATRY